MLRRRPKLAAMAAAAVSIALVACSGGASALPTATPEPRTTPTPVRSIASADENTPSPAATAVSPPATATPRPATPTIPAPPPTVARASGAPVIPNDDGTVDRIAFVSPDSQIFTVKPDGTNVVRISPERGTILPGDFTAGYTWPGWSPDAGMILYSAALPPGAGQSPYVLLATSSDGSAVEEPEVLYQNDPGTGTIVPGGPHYGLWSPDNTKVASIVATTSGLAVILSDTVKQTTIPIVPGAPVYLSWSPDSTQLIVHLMDRLLRFDAPFTQGVSAVLDGGSTRYFAPTYAPNDERVAFLVDNDNGATLNIQDPADGTTKPITDIDSVAWFRWSPDGKSLAVLKGGGLSDSSAVWLIAADGSSEELLARGRFLMLMWSPDGTKMLLARQSEEVTSRLKWSVLDMATRKITDLVEFTPSPELQQLHTFFDQYSASHTFWSPDSKSIVFAGLLHNPLPRQEDRARGADTVWVVDVDGTGSPRAVADGFLAFWSPR